MRRPHCQSLPTLLNTFACAWRTKPATSFRPFSLRSRASSRDFSSRWCFCCAFCASGQSGHIPRYQRSCSAPVQPPPLTGQKNKGFDRSNYSLFSAGPENQTCAYLKSTFQTRKTEVCVPKIARAARKIVFSTFFA